MEKSKNETPILSPIAEALQKAASDSAEIADHIRQISAAMKRIDHSGLKRRALVLLIKDEIASPPSISAIDSVLTAIGNLGTAFLNKK